MKNPFESAETFNAWSQIPMWYDFLNNAFKEWKGKLPKNRLEMEIDKSTGYDKSRDKNFAESAIPCLENIIAFKKVLEDDYSKDEKALAEVLKMF